MVNLTDTGRQDETSTVRVHEPISSRTRRMNIADNGKVINAANGDVRVDNQNIAGAAEVVHMNDQSTSVTSTGAKNDARNVVNLHFEQGSQYDLMSRAIPKDDAAAFLDLRLPNAGLPLTSNYQPTWNETYGNFSDPRELSLQRRNTFTLWHDIEVTDAMQSVQNALVAFCQRMGFQDPPSVKPSWALVKKDIRQAGSRARKHYKKENMLDRMVDLIRDINGFLSSEDDFLFLGWLDWLPEDKFKYCLAYPVKYILIPLVDCYPFDYSTIEHLRNILSLFSKSRAYVQLCRERRPTTDMPATTVYIFTQTAKLISSLLDFSCLKSRKKGGHSRHIQSLIDQLRQTLEDINRSAKVKLRGGGRIRTGRDDGNSTLMLYTSFHNLFREVPAIYTPRDSAYYTRRMSQAASEFQREDSNTYTSSYARESTPEDVMSKREVLDALSFRYNDNKEDINECLKYAELSAYEKSQLASLTREDAFQEWLQEDRWSTAIVIHGNLDDDDNSPIGYLAAQIGRKYAKKRGFVVLSWFCGLHSDDGVTSILARLTGQLLSQANPLLPSENINLVSRNEYKKLKRRDLNTLTRVFSNTIQELGSKSIVIFCLIDSISVFETGNSEIECEKMVIFFRDLVRAMRRRRQNDQKHRMVFKLLLSEDQSSELAAKYFEKEILEMDEGIDTEVDSDASIVNSD